MAEEGQPAARRRRTRVVVIVGLVVVLLGGGFIVWRATAPTAKTAASKPNIVLIMADDQTLESMRVLESTRRLIGEQGTTFSHYYASFPNCCPSRATALTGQYSHNNGVRDNVPPLGGAGKLKADETLPVWLQRAGYHTSSVGKYLNTWGADDNIEAPPGWSHWFGLIDPTTYNYFDYSVSDDGVRKDFGAEESDYQTDVLGAEVVRTIDERSKTGTPFFVSFTPLAPHVEEPEGDAEFGFISPGPVPAPRHAGRFANEPLPKTAAYDQPDVSGMPNFIRFRTRLAKSAQELSLENYRKELETLLALDEWVAKIVQSLKDNDVYDNTVVVFTSDNGLFHGEHRIPNGKLYLYEEGSHVPFLIAGPGIPRGAVAEQAVGNVDLAPTIAAIAGATPTIPQDGRDVRPLATDADTGQGRGILLENQLGGRLHSEAIHTGRYFYAEHSSGDKELFDLQVDPAQTFNLIDAPRYAFVRSNLAGRLAILRTCAGETCEGADPAADPAGAPKPLPAKPGQSDTPHTAPPPTRPPDDVLDTRIKSSVATITSRLPVLPEQRECLVRVMKDDPTLIDNGDVPAMQDLRTGGSLIIVMKRCVDPESFATFLTQLLGFFSSNRIDSTTAECTARALTALTEDKFAPIVRYLTDPASLTDPSVHTLTADLLRGCGVDPDTLVEAPTAS